MDKLEEVLEIVANVLEKPVDPDEDLESQGMDSLNLMHLMYQLEITYNIQFIDDDLRKINFKTIYNICCLLKSKLEEHQENEKDLSAPFINIGNQKIKCILRGGCDLRRTEPFLSLGTNLCVQSELTYVSPNGVIIRNDHLEILKNSLILTEEQKQEQIKNFPF
ncbi:hypothetical protein COK86_27340 [Bacillus cereus]|uniref:Carrier domain-containing protein n=1 Tax=Bacillus cereus TaxID=1396 RepID=A0A2B3TKV2_BACCE|nr:acyl carrier protein [Bacillus cereus]PFU37811.1 hypothetical protein COK86_27340 [Bacillus cereus]